MSRSKKIGAMSDMIAKRVSVDELLDRLKEKQAESNFPSLHELLSSFVAEECDDDRVTAEALLNSMKGVQVNTLRLVKGKYNAQATKDGVEVNVWVRKKENGTWEVGAGNFPFGTIALKAQAEEE